MNNERLDIQGRLGENISKIYLEASDNNQIENVYVQFQDGGIEVFNRGEKSYENFAAIVRRTVASLGGNATNKGTAWIIDYKENLPKDIIGSLEDSINLDINTESENSLVEEQMEVEGYNNTVVYDGKVNEKIANKVLSIKKGIAVFGLSTVGISSLAGALAGCNWPLQKTKAAVVSESNDDISPEVEEEIEEVKLSLEGKDWDYYVENFKDSEQKNPNVAYYNYLNGFNNSEDWMTIDVTSEMKDELANEFDTHIEEDKAIFGFTAENVHALNLAYGRHTNEEYAIMNNCEYIDIAKVFNGNSSEFADANLAATNYYLAPDSNAHIGLENVIEGLNQNEIDELYKAEDMWFDIKTMIKEDKSKDEIFTAMKEFKSYLLKLSNTPTNVENNLKPYIVRTIGEAASVYSTNLLQLKDNLELTVYDNVAKGETKITVNTWLFDELSCRSMFYGFAECGNISAFNDDTWLKSVGGNTDRYTLIRTDSDVSFVDSYNGTIFGKLESANEYIDSLSEDKKKELTKDTYNEDKILELIDEKLKKDNKYPQAMDIFNSIYGPYAIFEDQYKEKNQITGKNTLLSSVLKTPKLIYISGSSYTKTYTRTWTESTSSTRTEIRHNDNWEEEYKKLPDQVEAKDVKTTVIDGDTGKEKEVSYQDIINSETKKRMDLEGVDTKDVNLDTKVKDNDKIDTSDQIVKNIVDEIDKNADEAKKLKEELENEAKDKYTDDAGNTHYITGGNINIDPEFADSFYNTSTPVVETPAPVVETPAPEQPSSTDAGSGSYTTEDPTSDDDFHPAYFEDTSESEIDEEIGKSL